MGTARGPGTNLSRSLVVLEKCIVPRYEVSAAGHVTRCFVRGPRHPTFLLYAFQAFRDEIDGLFRFSGFYSRTSESRQIEIALFK